MITQSLVLERTYAAPVITAILHTIIFHRYFGNITPRETQILSSAVTYASVDDANVMATVDDKVDELMQSLSTTTDTKTQIAVFFTETKARKAAWFSSKSEEQICWEQWTIELQSKCTSSEQERNQLLNDAINQAKRAIFAVIKEVDQNKDHIPLIVNSQTNPFPYHITVAAAAPGLWSSMIRRAILPGIS